MPPYVSHSDFQDVILRKWEESLYPGPERKESGGIFTELSCLTIAGETRLQQYRTEHQN